VKALINIEIKMSSSKPRENYLSFFGFIMAGFESNLFVEPLLVGVEYRPMVGEIGVQNFLYQSTALH
jgi:hypothetical protein